MTFRLSKLTTAHLPLLVRLQDEAFAALPDPALLRPNSPEMLERCLLQPNVTFGAWHGDSLAAIAVLYVPSDLDEDLAGSLREVVVCPPAANFKLCIVRPQFRGHGLQRKLGLLVEQEARALGCGVLCATASPLNTVSCLNLTAQGFILNRCLLKYGLERNLYYKSL